MPKVKINLLLHSVGFWELGKFEPIIAAKNVLEIRKSCPVSHTALDS